MQAIARVNRVYGEKPGGLVVDLIGLADPLADALATYANATGETDRPVKELQDEAIPAMRSAFEQLQAFFHGCNYASALEAEPANVLRVYLRAIDHVLDVKHNVGEEMGWQRFRGMVSKRPPVTGASRDEDQPPPLRRRRARRARLRSARSRRSS
jgi:type I restriction enzyme R subunit